MLEHVPAWIGALLRNVRAGHSKLVIVQEEIGIAAVRVDLSSPAFGNGARIPERFTADGEGLSPPLVWGDLPEGTASLALIVEDPDAPAINPFVHALVWHLPVGEHRLAEGAIVRNRHGQDTGWDVGRNSYFAKGWLPPDPPTGHGIHDYVFQLFALAQTPAISSNPGRAEVVEAIRGHVLGAGLLVGTYSRGQPADPSHGTVSGAAPI